MEIYKILMFFLAFSLLLSTLTASRDLKEIGEDIVVVPQEFQDEVLMMDLSEKREEKLEVIKRRMDIEINDYSGTGANTHHDPKPPGTTG